MAPYRVWLVVGPSPHGGPAEAAAKAARDRLFRLCGPKGAVEGHVHCDGTLHLRGTIRAATPDAALRMAESALESALGYKPSEWYAQRVQIDSLA